MSDAADKVMQAMMANPMLMRQFANIRESQFQSGIKATPWYSEFKREFGEEPNLNSPDYDYRKAWSAGVRPEKDQYDNGLYHWPSVDPSGVWLKSATHPTAWKETFMQRTGQNPDALGINSPDAANAYFQGRK